MAFTFDAEHHAGGERQPDAHEHFRRKSGKKILPLHAMDKLHPCHRVVQQANHFDHSLNGSLRNSIEPLPS